MTKRYEFAIILAGYGDDPEKAWIDACENFESDWGSAPEEYEITDEEA
jgi:hypothetical protein